MSATGAKGRGTIFRITPDGDYKVLHHFNDLGSPQGDLLLASDGYLYGTASEGGAKGSGYGGIFRIKPDGKNYKVLHTFNNTNGAEPWGGLVQAADGDLYGTTKIGGTGNRIRRGSGRSRRDNRGSGYSEVSIATNLSRPEVRPRPVSSARYNRPSTLIASCTAARRLSRSPRATISSGMVTPKRCAQSSITNQ